MPPAESLKEKFLKAKVKMKQKAAKRNKRGKNCNSKWNGKWAILF
jgi:hypothetical protein